LKTSNVGHLKEEIIYLLQAEFLWKQHQKKESKQSDQDSAIDTKESTIGSNEASKDINFDLNAFLNLLPSTEIILNQSGSKFFKALL
jgi:hypothetical protein